MLTAALCLPAFAEETQNAGEQKGTEEQGYEEIQPLMEMNQIEQTEGMNLEEVTKAFDLSVMSEYYDSVTGFSMQYPSQFRFDEGKEIPTAVTEDDKAWLTIENYSESGGLSQEMLLEAIKLEMPDGEVQKNEENGSLRTDRELDGGKRIQTDIYFITSRSFHHITIEYPAEDQTEYASYINYMINSMTANETDMG